MIWMLAAYDSLHLFELLPSILGLVGVLCASDLRCSGNKNYVRVPHWRISIAPEHSLLNGSNQRMLVEKFEESFTSSAAMGLGSAVA